MTGDKLKELRKENNIKQITVAKYLEISQPAYSKFENNESVLNAIQIIKICKFYNITSDSLLGVKYGEEKSYIEREFNKLTVENKAIISTMINSLIQTQDVGKSSYSQNKKSNAG